MYPFILVILLSLAGSGCLTYSKFTKIIDKNPKITSQQLEEKLGTKPKKTIELAPNVFYCTYQGSWNNFTAYFLDDKIFNYGEDSFGFHLGTQYRLGLISKDEFNQELQFMQQQEIIENQRRAIAFQFYNQQQALNQQQQYLELLESQNKKPIIYPSSLITPKTNTYNTYCSSSGNQTHCQTTGQ